MMTGERPAWRHFGDVGRAIHIDPKLINKGQVAVADLARADSR
jgi:hypothetical protein